MTKIQNQSIGHRSLPLTDAHIHATAYRMSGTCPDMTATAILAHCRKLGFRSIGLVEHLNGTQKHPIECMRRLADEVREIVRHENVIDIRLGSEVDIISADGALRMESSVRNELGLDYLIASIHNTKLAPADAPMEEFIAGETTWMTAAVRSNSNFDILGHPWSVSRRRPGWRFSAVMPEHRQCLIEALAANHVAINFTHRELKDIADPEFCGFLRELLQAGVKIAVGSDAHAMPSIEMAVHLTTWLVSQGVGGESIWWPVEL